MTDIFKKTIKKFLNIDFIKIFNLDCSYEQQSLASENIIMKQGKKSVSCMSDLQNMFKKKNLNLIIIHNTWEIKVNVFIISIFN